MPKKFQGTNSKAAEARQRKEDRRLEEKAKKEKELEDKFWEDDDKHVNRKLQRKEDREKKRQDQLERKKELATLADEELGATAGASKKQPAQPKVTLAQVEANAEARRAKEVSAAAEAEKQRGGRVVDIEEEPLPQNLNRVEVDGAEARTVEDAIRVLSVGGDEADRHPEKRMKAAYAAFEAARMPVLKEERPNMRLSQLKQILRKEWMKSPENPVNREIEGR